MSLLVLLLLSAGCTAQHPAKALDDSIVSMDKTLHGEADEQPADSEEGGASDNPQEQADEPSQSS